MRLVPWSCWIASATTLCSECGRQIVKARAVRPRSIKPQTGHEHVASVLASEAHTGCAGRSGSVPNAPRGTP